MADKDCILLVEDEPVQRMRAVALLEDYYRVLEATSGLEAIEMVRDHQPDLVLMDILMPQMNGLQACELIRDDPIVGETPVLFLSTEVTLEDRLAAYAVGGEDFIGKPFDPTELLAKVESTLRLTRERKQLRSDARMAFDTAMSAMSTSGELGQVLQCLRIVMACEDMHPLANAALQTCAEYGLKACIQIRVEEAIYSRNLDGEATELEKGTLHTLQSCGRIVSMKQYAAFNYGRVTLMVSNMPLDDPDRAGRMRDNLALIAEGVDAKAAVLEMNAAERRHQTRIRELLTRSVDTLKAIDRRNQLQRGVVKRLLMQMIDQAEQSFLSMGLTDAQEQLIALSLRDTADSLNQLLEEGLEVDQHLAILQQDLTNAQPDAAAETPD
ncbi:response regulator [Parachitinimonas caeni]|uniref:Response regulator n=1 Tax=Parachitinimonas caeni TaxID=3031301 RepID=A0ABT7E2J7_9NEIS|nr:response regulator [Parachitinimonas caeni]MDK2125620.1 response regulator [Parachitinimonas caeni]